MPLFERTIAQHTLKMHLGVDTGALNWIHLAAIIIAFHTSKLCVGMHFFSVPAGEVFVIVLCNVVAPAWCTAAFLCLASLWYASLDLVGGIATAAGLSVSFYGASFFHASAMASFGVSSLHASILVAACSFMGSFGSTPLSHGYFERGSDDVDLEMEMLPNLISKVRISLIILSLLSYFYITDAKSRYIMMMMVMTHTDVKALIPLNTKLEMLYWMRVYSNRPLWRRIDSMAKEM